MQTIFKTSKATRTEMLEHKSISATKSPFWIGVDAIAAEINKPPLDTINEVPIAGEVVVITGASSGIGAAAALEFAKRAAKVIMPCVNMDKGLAVTAQIKDEVPDADLNLMYMDLGDLDSVRACAAQIRSLVSLSGSGIKVLVNNAGVWDPNKKLRHTKDGFELHFGVNYLGPFLFTNLLLDLVQAGAPSRILFTSSLVHQLADLDLSDMNCEKRGMFGYGLGPYSNSKLANMYNVYSLAKRLNEATGVNTYALCPGPTVSGITRNLGGILRLLTSFTYDQIALDPKEGADTILYCALSKECAHKTGLMYRCNGLWKGAMEAAIDDQVADELWELSEKLIQTRSKSSRPLDFNHN